MKILVSACIMGVDCKYNGKNNKNLIAPFLKKSVILPHDKLAASVSAVVVLFALVDAFPAAWTFDPANLQFIYSKIHRVIV